MSTPFNPLDYPICFTQPQRLVDSAWVEHIPFAMVLMEITQPGLLVELGTHTGVSYCAFCQAIKELKIGTKCYAVDTWKGDSHVGFYGSEVLTDLRAHHDPLYCEFSSLLQSTFDDALKNFNDGSIDILHIDGLHTYEAVKHDFEAWLPKLSSKSIVLFHDITERKNDFGVWKLWDELKSIYPSFEFIHGHGLGVLAVGQAYPPSMDMLFKSSIEIPNIQEFFYHLGYGLDRELSIKVMTDQLNQANSRIYRYTHIGIWWITKPVRKLIKLITRGKQD